MGLDLIGQVEDKTDDLGEAIVYAVWARNHMADVKRLREIYMPEKARQALAQNKSRKKNHNVISCGPQQ